MRWAWSTLFSHLLMNAAPMHLWAQRLCWATMSACVTPTVAAQHNAASEPDSVHTILFEVSVADNAHHSYLFGTHHAFGEQFLDTMDLAREKLRTCDVLVVECIGSAEAVVNARGTRTDWSAYLSPKDLAYLRELFTTSDVQLDLLTPTELHAALARYHAIKNCKARSAADSSRTLDDAIIDLAVEAGMELVGLETAEAQLELLRKDVEGMPRKVHARRLAAAIAQIRSGGTSGCNEVQRYASVQWDLHLHAPCTNTLMLTERNARWMERIGPLLHERSCFIAVGLSHLMYDCGLISELRERGFRVEPVPLRSSE